MSIFKLLRAVKRSDMLINKQKELVDKAKASAGKWSRRQNRILEDRRNKWEATGKTFKDYAEASYSPQDKSRLERAERKYRSAAERIKSGRDRVEKIKDIKRKAANRRNAAIALTTGAVAPLALYGAMKARKDK